MQNTLAERDRLFEELQQARHQVANLGEVTSAEITLLRNELASEQHAADAARAAANAATDDGERLLRMHACLVGMLGRCVLLPGRAYLRRVSTHQSTKPGSVRLLASSIRGGVSIMERIAVGVRVVR